MRAALLAIVVSAGGCGGFHLVADGGDADAGSDGGGAIDMTVLNACTSTSQRSREPLGMGGRYSLKSSFAWAGDEMGVVWEDVETNGTTGTIYFARVDGLGAIDSPQSLGSGYSPVLLRNDQGLRLFWNRDGDLATARLDDTGVVIGTPSVVYSPIAQDIAAAWNGTEYGLLLDGWSTDTREVAFLRVGADGTAIGQPQLVPQVGGGLPNSVLPSIAWDGAHYGLAWIDVRSGLPAIYSALFDAQGKRVTDDLLLSQAGMSAAFPSVAVQNTGGFVVCYEVKIAPANHDIWCDRLDAQGMRTNSARVTENATDSISPQPVGAGKFTWVVFADEEPASMASHIYWQFLDATGTTVLPQPKDSLIDAWQPHVAATPTGLYLTEYSSQDGVSFTAEASIINCY